MKGAYHLFENDLFEGILGEFPMDILGENLEFLGKFL
jgi:hypothetical protein